MLRQLEDLWTYAQSIASEEDRDPEPPEFKELSKEKIKDTAEKIDRMFKGSPVEKSSSKTKAKAKLKYIKNNFEKNLDKYSEQEEILAGRGSHSKTDPDATFMNDTGTLAWHLEDLKENLGEEIFSKIESATTDAGYGSEENYELLEIHGIDAYIKYNTFDKEQDANYQKKHKAFSKEHLYYNQEKDFYVCPMGQRMHKTHESRRITKNGFEQKLSHYQAKNRDGCPVRSVCHQPKANRSIERNHNFERHKQKARERLLSEESIKKRKQRCYDVEPVFAHLKHNHHFKRFTLKSLKKVEIEFELHALAHNLRKKVA